MPPGNRPVDRAPVSKVGGPKENGPWSEELEEIAVDDRLRRPVRLENGRVEEREVHIVDLQQIIRDDGTETDGYAVGYQIRNDE